MKRGFSGLKITEGNCEYECGGKQTPRGFRVFCHRTDKKCKPSAHAPATTPPRTPATPKAMQLWEMTSSAYLASIHVHEPWIGEISQAQFASMSKRQQEAYEKKRRDEWQAAADARQQWKNLIGAAYERGEITLDTKMTDEAHSALFWYIEGKKEKDIEAKVAQAEKENRITDVTQLDIGDRVFDLMLHRYATVLKKFKTSVRIRTEKGGGYGADKEMTVPVRELQWKEYNDLEEAAKKGLPIKPR